MKKRLLAIVMTMAMALSLLPVTALADGADIGSQPAGQVQEDPDLGNTGGGGDDPLPGDGPNEGDDPTLPGDGPDEGNDPTLPGDGPDEGNDPTLPGDGPDKGNDPSLPGDGPDAGDDPSVEGVLTAATSDAIAAIGDTEYTTLEEFANALKGIKSETETKVELLSDLVNYNYDKVVDLSLPSNVTLEGNNNTIEGNIKVTVQKDASNVTIQNAMFKDIHNNVDVGSGGNYGFNNKTGNLTAIYGSGLTGTFTITGCTFENVDWDAIQITPLKGANITITDNIFRTDAECQTVRFIHVESAQNTDFSICATRNKFFGVEALNQTGLEVYYPVNADKVNLSGNYMDAPMAVCIGTGGTSYNNAWQKACPFKDENLDEDIMPIAMREVSAGNRLYLTEDEVAADGVKVLAGENCYDTISAAISAASGSSIQVKLLNDLKEDITIPEGKTLTLDLNGQTLTNASSHTIVNHGTLTILDSAGGGVVDVVTHGKAALYNKGAIPEISGGTFTRSKEAGTTEGGNGNSWYTVYNAGTIEKITGGTFENSGTFSSMLVNGWNNPGPAVQGYIGTISGGTFTGGSITIKNDDGGKIDKICGDAVITNETQTAIQNTSTIGEISGGTISGGGRAIYNSSWKDGAEEYIGTITIKDGAVIKGGINNTNWGGSSNTVTQFAKTTIEGGKISGSLTDDGLSASGCQIVISGGYFTADPTSYLVSGKDAVASNQDGYQYMVGTLALSQQTLALTKGGEAVLSVNAEPWGAVPASAVSWSSDNEAVAAVDNGTVTAAAPGTATITAEVNGKSLTCSVTVSYAGVDGISLDRSALTLVSGGSTALTATVSPSNADQTVTWTSSDEAVATVAQDGTVTAVAAGEAIITASAGAYRASCTVTVTGADVDVLPSTEPTETVDQLPDGLNDEVKEAVNEAAGTVNAGSALSQAAQEQAGQLADSAEKDELLQKGQSELGSEEIVLYTQTYLQVTTVDALTGTDGSINSVTLDISPKGQVVASTASTAGDINQGNSVVVKEIPQEDLNITGTAHVTLTLPDDFAGKTIYIKHQASNGRTYFYTAEADEGANLTFSTRHGFSPFTFSLTNEAAAQVEDVGYADLQDAIDAVADGGTITVLKDGLGTVTIQGSKTFTLVKGEDVDTLPTLVAASGYRLTDHGNGSYTISRRSSGGGSSGSATYTVSVDSSRHGDVTVSPKSASKGTTVTITVKPDDGYELDELTVTDKDGDSIKLKDKGDGRFTFTMPASKVTVEAVFTALEQEEEQPLFSDVAEDDWYYDAVAYVAENGIMSGTDGSCFSPNGTLTRAMLSQILYAMEDKPAVSGAATFSDVAAGAWYADAVNWTAAQGIVAGMGENSFAPDAPVTREQLSLILYGYARYKGYDTSASVSLSGYADRDSVAVWAADSMGWAVSEGLISGRPGGYLDPAGTATRAEVAQILMNFCEDLAR
ncbi:S-layer homology domain-containing protein [Clostridium phoceensis]|uniref:S-layer homology domain-containing protein n=1 Tax=Clostridium phoceensis TaxID=1650661 RepID=UPI0009E51A07|nr:S-layer homology domain-containing protein [Clostridium phoceensis]